MRSRAFVLFALALPLAPFASAQSVISAHSGLINYFEGMVFLDGQPVTARPGTYARLKDGSTLMTESGRVEVLLTPNTYFRMGENGTMRMVSDDLSDTRVELLAGSASLDSAKAPEGDFVKVVFHDSTISILKPGRYRIDADPAQFRVYEGEADVARNGTNTKIESAQIMPLDGAPVVKRFTQGSDSLLDIWADERGSLIANNMVGSQSITDPLVDNGPDLSAGLTDPGVAYGGYIPLATLPPSTGGVYGYSTYGMNPYALNPYGFSPYGFGAYGLGLGYRAYSYGGYAPVYSRPYGTVRPLSPGSSVFMPRPMSPAGGVHVPRPAFGIRPAPSAIPRAGAVHPVGRR